MMFYMIRGEDRPDALAARLAARPAHLARLQALRTKVAFSWPAPALPSIVLTPVRLVSLAV